MTVLAQSTQSADGRSTLVPCDGIPIWRLSVEKYHAMIDAGILVEGDPVELLDGWLVHKMGKNPPHSVATQSTGDALRGVLPAGWSVNYQEPVTTETSEPEPDVSVIRGKRRDYMDHHPSPADVGLLVEVAEASLSYDRGPKKRVYARDRFPVYWIINLVENQIEVYTDPSGPAEQPDYRQRQVFRPGEEIPVVLDGREVGRLAVRDLLP
jgi:Uma2 family endonuclease